MQKKNKKGWGKKGNERGNKRRWKTVRMKVEGRNKEGKVKRRKRKVGNSEIKMERRKDESKTSNISH